MTIWEHVVQACGINVPTLKELKALPQTQGRLLLNCRASSTQEMVPGPCAVILLAYPNLRDAQ